MKKIVVLIFLSLIIVTGDAYLAYNYFFNKTGTINICGDVFSNSDPCAHTKVYFVQTEDQCIQVGGYWEKWTNGWLSSTSCFVESRTKQSNTNSANQAADPKTKCENSGGKWWNPCETGECFKCDCNVGNVLGGEREDRKLLIDGVCVACISDEQCGDKFCAQRDNSCKEQIGLCENGICKSKIIEYGTVAGSKTHQCQNNACVPINEIINKATGFEKECLAGGGRWTYMSNGCGDDCYDKTQGTPMCTQAFTWKCNCGDNQCWDGKKCVED